MAGSWCKLPRVSSASREFWLRLILLPRVVEKNLFVVKVRHEGVTFKPLVRDWCLSGILVTCQDLMTRFCLHRC